MEKAGRVKSEIERPMSALRTAESLLLVTLRLYALRRYVRNAPDWRNGLRAAGVSEFTLTALGGFLTVIASSARRSLEVRSLRYGYVSEDEDRFLRVIGALQNRRPHEAAEILGAWLPASACRLAVDPAELLANGLTLSGLFVPCDAMRRSVPAYSPYLNANPGLALMQ